MTNDQEVIKPVGYIAFGKNESGIRQAGVFIEGFGLSIVPWPEGQNPVHIDLSGGYRITLWRYPNDKDETVRVHVGFTSSSEQEAIVEGFLVPDCR